MENAVVLACDANYAPYAFFVAEQIAIAHPRRPFDICIFSEDCLSVPEGLKNAGIRVETISGQNPFCNGPNPSRHGTAAYLRLLVPPLVRDRYKRLLYLDSDIFLNRSGIQTLFDAGMRDSAIAAVRDNIQWRTPGRHAPEFKILGLPALPYFNSGMLLIDVERYCKEDVLEKCLQIFANHPKAVPRHDQSLLNLAMHGRWTELSPSWNWQYTWSSRFFADLVDPHLIHFIGPKKPWKDTGHTLPRRYRQAYAAFLRTHYPLKQDMDSINPDALGWPDKLGRTFLKHFFSLMPMKRYLARYGHELVTHRVG